MRARNHSGRWACAMLALALSACHAGSDNAAEVQPPDTAAQKIPARPDPDQPVASGNTPAAADIAAIAALNASFDPQRDPADDLDTAKVEAQRAATSRIASASYPLSSIRGFACRRMFSCKFSIRFGTVFAPFMNVFTLSAALS